MTSCVNVPTNLITDKNLTPQAFRIIVYILAKKEEAQESFELHTKEWAQDLNCAPSTIRRWVNYLCEQGFLVLQEVKKRIKHFVLKLGRGKAAKDSGSHTKCGMTVGHDAKTIEHEAPPKQLPSESEIRAIDQSITKTKRQVMVNRIWSQVSEITGTWQPIDENKRLLQHYYRQELSNMWHKKTLKQS